MKRLLACIGCVWIFALAGCGGGSGGGETTPSAAPGDTDGNGGLGFPTILAGADTGGSTTTPGTTSFTGALSDIRFGSSYNLRILVTESGGEREVARFSDEDIVSTTDGLRLYQTQRAILISSTPEGVTLGQNLEYTTFGRWREFDVTGGLAFVDGAAFYAGVPTGSGSEMPTTGRANFVGAASGQELAKNQSSVTALFGSISATADFSSSTIDLRMQLSRPRGPEPWGEVTARGLTIEGDRFAGDSARSSRGHAGGASGRFFGPEAAEIGGVAELENDSSILQIGFGGAR